MCTWPAGSGVPDARDPAMIRVEFAQSELALLNHEGVRVIDVDPQRGDEGVLVVMALDLRE
jgi:hypothetical protein